jgi:hypothetical protein
LKLTIGGPTSGQTEFFWVGATSGGVTRIAWVGAVAPQ